MPTDIDAYFQRLKTATSSNGLEIRELGYVGSYPLLLVEPQNTSGPNILVAGGFHGEEPAGPWGILRFLETHPHELLSRVNLSFLPLVNPTGFVQGQRLNDWGENPNSGFCHGEARGGILSREGRILLDNISLLRPLADDGFVSLHEDSDQSGFYLYTFEQSEIPGQFTRSLRDAGLDFFDCCSDEIAGETVEDGVVYCQCDGSFEDFLFHEGVPRTACTETPGRLNINARINCNCYIIQNFINYSIGAETSF